MMKHTLLLLALSAIGCDQGVAPRAHATVTLTSVAFADDCGGTPPSAAPMPAAAPRKNAVVPSAMAVRSEEREAGSAVRRRCEQTSMQLAIVGDTGSALHIKAVEVFDADGTSLGKLSASKPTRWDDAKAAYETWDEKVVAVPMAVSYVLSQPAFVDRYDARDRTYKVKVIASLGGVDQPLLTTVMVVGRPPPVPT
jgi:hypothetical protein